MKTPLGGGGDKESDVYVHFGCSLLTGLFRNLKAPIQESENHLYGEMMDRNQDLFA